ncbi:HAD family hydrolase [Actinopolymorpha sp. B9G3]|uniref:HAD family hydrolase n=1 Tax=Actinopolymorpha sp. B9G3 TaxID=3158970 RepID=UPI0032D9629C
MVALDLDGTILESGTTIDHQVLTTLETLQTKGVMCVTATGRPLDFQVELFERHNVGPAAGRFAALIANEREIHLLDEHRQPAPAYHPYDEWNVVIRKRWDALIDEAMRWVDRVAAEADRRGWMSRRFDRSEIARRGLATIRLELSQHAAVLRDWLADQLLDAESELACNRNTRLVQVVDRQAGKGNVLATLADLCGVPADQVLAIGDSSNDMSMLDGAFGFRAATPGNADAEVKDAVRKCGGYVAQARVGAGVIEALTAVTALVTPTATTPPTPPTATGQSPSQSHDTPV